MNRVVLIGAGVVLCLLGSLGLVAFGPAIAQMPSVLFKDGGEADNLDPFRLAAASAVLMALGATLMGLVAQRDSVVLSRPGKAAVSLSSFLVVLSACALLYSLFLEMQSVDEVTRAESVSPQELQTDVEEALLPARFGFGLLAAAQAVALAGAFQLKPAKGSYRSLTPAKLAGVTYMVTGWIIAVIFLMIWLLDSPGLEPFGVSDAVARVATSMRAVLIKSLLMCVCLLLQAGCLAAIGLSRVREE